MVSGTISSNVITASDEAEFADHTLSVPGDAIFNDASSVRAIIRQVESQRLESARGSHTGVAEERAVYHIGRACLASASSSVGRISDYRSPLHLLS